MAKPNVFVVGAAKCGTTSLVDYLKQHPSIFCPQYKEPCYFISGFGCSETEYRKLYRNRVEPIRIDASTPYLFEQSVPMKISKYDPGSKIIIMLRDPASMAYSLWQYMCAIGNEAMTFENAILSEESGFRGGGEFRAECSGWPGDYLYKERARYFSQVKRYYSCFAESSIKIVVFEDFIKNPSAVCQDISCWLGVDEFGFDTSVVSNEGGVARFKFINYIRSRQYPFLKRVLPLSLRAYFRRLTRVINLKKSERIPMNLDTRAKLNESYNSDVEQLGKLIGRDLLSIWRL